MCCLEILAGSLRCTTPLEIVVTKCKLIVNALSAVHVLSVKEQPVVELVSNPLV